MSGGIPDIQFTSLATESVSRVESANVVFYVKQDIQYLKELNLPSILQPFEIRTNSFFTFDKLKELIVKVVQGNR